VRSHIPTRLVALVLVFILLPSVPSLALAQAPVPSVPAAQGPAPVDLAWPRQMETGGNVILIYQPQPVKWEGNRLEARAAEGFSLHADVADSSVIAWRRKTTEAVEIGGVPVPVGANLLLGSANRDPAAFETPERFDIHRLKPVGTINVESLERNVRTLQGDLLSERFGSMNTVAAASRSWLSRCHAERGAFTEGLAMAEEGLRIAETVNNSLRLIDACQGVSWLYLRWGDVHRAMPTLERALVLCQDLHVPPFVPWVAAALGLAYTMAGRVAAGLALVEHGVEQEIARGRPQYLPSVVTQLSQAYLLAGRLDEARQRAEQAVERARQYQFHSTQAWALWLLAESMARQWSPEVEPATGHYRQALDLAEELGMRPLQAHCHRGLGMLYGTLGRQEPARREISTAIAMYRTMAMTFWLPQAEAALAHAVRSTQA
jgi:tetratricopeptide (TPR) repeat protein